MSSCLAVWDTLARTVGNETPLSGGDPLRARDEIRPLNTLEYTLRSAAWRSDTSAGLSLVSSMK